MNNTISISSKTCLLMLLGASVCLSATYAQAWEFSWEQIKNQLPWNKPAYKVADGVSDVSTGIKSGVCKVADGVTQAMYNFLTKCATVTGLNSAWTNHRKATALTLTAAAGLAIWGIYRTGYKHGKKDAIRAIAHVVDEPEVGYVPGSEGRSAVKN